METKYLWSIIDLLRDELNIASDGINDLNDALKDMQRENDSLKDEAIKWNRKYNKLENEGSKPTFH